MIRGFTFERALSWPFTAAHAATFPWIFGAAYALVLILFYGLIGLLAADDFVNWFTALEAADASTDPDEQMALAFGGFARLLPWGLLGGLALDRLQRQDDVAERPRAGLRRRRPMRGSTTWCADSAPPPGWAWPRYGR